MTLHVDHDRLNAFLDTLARLEPTQMPDAFYNETVETGGVYMRPDPKNTWSSHMFEISLHGVSAVGTSEAEAIRNWIKVAHATFVKAADSAAVEDDGFITVHPPCQTTTPRRDNRAIARTLVAQAENFAALNPKS